MGGGAGDGPIRGQNRAPPAETAMEMTPSPVRPTFSAPSDSEEHHTGYPSDDAGAEPDFLAGRTHTAPIPELAHDTGWESLP